MANTVENFPDDIDVTLSSRWTNPLMTAGGIFTGGEVVSLTKYSGDNGTISITYTEDGTATWNDTTNRMSLKMFATTNASMSIYAYFYYASWFYGMSVVWKGEKVSAPTYSFKDLFNSSSLVRTMGNAAYFISTSSGISDSFNPEMFTAMESGVGGGGGGGAAPSAGFFCM